MRFVIAKGKCGEEERCNCYDNEKGSHMKADWNRLHCECGRVECNVFVEESRWWSLRRESTFPLEWNGGYVSSTIVEKWMTFLVIPVLAWISWSFVHYLLVKWCPHSSPVTQNGPCRLIDMFEGSTHRATQIEMDRYITEKKRRWITLYTITKISRSW